MAGGRAGQPGAFPEAPAPASFILLGTVAGDGMHAPSIETGRRAALGDYRLRRTFERAKVAEWTADLRLAADLVHDLADDLRALVRRGSLARTAGEAFEPDRIKADDFKLQSMRADLNAYAARWDLVQRLAHVSGVYREYGKTFSRSFTLGSLSLPDLDALGNVHLLVGQQVAAMEHVFTTRFQVEARAGPAGRLPDIASRFLVEWCDAAGAGLTEMARDALALGVEERVVGDSGNDPASLVADSWRKKRRKERSTPRNQKKNRRNRKK